MKPSTAADATRLLTSEKAWGMIEIDTTARTAPAAIAWAPPTSAGLASKSTVPPRTVAPARARPIAPSSETAKRFE
jgi:hypothetical protein